MIGTIRKILFTSLVAVVEVVMVMLQVEVDLAAAVAVVDTRASQTFN
jgi:hypothetical protein